ncbi:hypothetical protein LX36DRAFT_236708 [Colletotrichum falcatum]|nr:hypothetical protein LX36DRAFT_236708 [Colletotrichum falcatum]
MRSIIVAGTVASSLSASSPGSLSHPPHLLIELVRLEILLTRMSLPVSFRLDPSRGKEKKFLGWQHRSLFLLAQSLGNLLWPSSWTPRWSRTFGFCRFHDRIIMMKTPSFSRSARRWLLAVSGRVAASPMALGGFGIPCDKQK